MSSRDARHLSLEQVGSAGQEKIAAGKVLIIGVGGIGCAAAQTLASSGVGQITLVDFDTVDASNLGRQVLYTPADVGARKVDIAAARLAAGNPDIRISTIAERLSDDALDREVHAADIVLDGCDNFSTRFQVNASCVSASRRLVSGAAIRFEGQLAVFGADYADSPCYRCVYSEADESLLDCSGNGVLGPLPGVIGNLMAIEALKSLAGISVAVGRLLLFDAASTEFRSLAINKQVACPTCA